MGYRASCLRALGDAIYAQGPRFRGLSSTVHTFFELSGRVYIVLLAHIRHSADDFLVTDLFTWLSVRE
jgi:hypothetical protein